MKPFELGWIPEGWTRGDPLVFSRAVQKGNRGFVHRRAPPDFDEAPAPCDEVLYTFAYEQIEQFNAWFAWWNNNEI